MAPVPVPAEGGPSRTRSSPRRISLAAEAAGDFREDMDPWAPINGLSLERYAELAADVEGTQDPSVQAAIVAAKGVSPIDWEAAKAGWTARMQDASLMGQVSSRFMPMYHAALARRNAGAPRNDAATYAVSGAMPGAVPHPSYGAAAAVSGAMPGAVPPPSYGPPAGYGPQAGYPVPAPQPWPHQPPQAYRPPPGYNAQAAAFGNEVGNAFSAFGSALGSVVSSVVGSFSYGQAVMVQWTDGQRYPATVILQQSGQVQVAFPDGRQVWVPQHVVVVR